MFLHGSLVEGGHMDEIHLSHVFIFSYISKKIIFKWNHSIFIKTNISLSWTPTCTSKLLARALSFPTRAFRTIYEWKLLMEYMLAYQTHVFKINPDSSNICFYLHQAESKHFSDVYFKMHAHTHTHKPQN